MYAPLIIGFIAAAAVSVYGSLFKLDRSPAFYPTAMIVIASYYILFAIMGGSRETLIVEIAIASVFWVAATVGHARNMWLVVIALAAHGVLDGFHGYVVVNPGVPDFWPAWCLGYDVVAAVGLAIVLVRRRAMPAL